MAEEEEEEEGTFEYKPSFVLIAIDTDPSMFVKNEATNSCTFRDSINACYNLANSLIFTQNKRSWNSFGIVLALEDSSASFVNFNDGVLDSIKFLKTKKSLSDEELKQTHERKSALDLSAFFLLCKKKFKEVNSVFYKQTIIFITNDDNPIRNDNNQRFAAINEAKNLKASEIGFEVVTMKENFDYTIFYNEMFAVMDVPCVEILVEDEDGLFEKISSSIVMKFHQRKLLFFPFIDKPEKYLKIVQKSVIREERLYRNAAVSESGKLLKKIAKNTIDTSNSFIIKEIEGIDFDLEEYLEILKNNLQDGYTLIFVTNYIKTEGFILKDPLLLEVDPKEDLPFFNTFWQYCIDKNKVLVCARKLKVNDKLRFVELIPRFANGSKVFLIKVIPFNDEIDIPNTKTDSTENHEYSIEKINIINEIINKLTFDYHPKMFVNPSAAKEKAFLKSKLLDEPKEDAEDVTLDTNGIDKSLGQIVDHFNQLFQLEDTGTKRKGTAAAGRSKRKK